MSDFVKEMIQEVEVRIKAYTAERDVLLKASDRIALLTTMIAEAEAEVISLKARLPKEEAESEQ